VNASDRDLQRSARAEIRLNIERALAEGFDLDFAEQVFAATLEYLSGEEQSEVQP